MVGLARTLYSSVEVVSPSILSVTSLILHLSSNLASNFNCLMLAYILADVH